VASGEFKKAPDCLINSAHLRDNQRHLGGEEFRRLYRPSNTTSLGCLSSCSYGAFTRIRWNALRQRMAEEESGAWGSVDTRDVIVRLTGQQTNHATSKLLTLSADPKS